MSKLKVLHFADIQYNVRGKHLNKQIEYEYINNQLVNAAKDTDIVLIAGDVFEHWDTNNMEEKLFIDLIHDMLTANEDLLIYCIAGNHDLKQKNNTYDRGDGYTLQYMDSLTKIDNAINDGRFVVLSESGLYQIADNLEIPTHLNDKFKNVVIAAWATNECYIDGCWSPWSPEYIGDDFDFDAFCKDNFVIEMFHAPVQNCINFDGNNVQGDNDSRQPVSVFQGHYVALGDIHKHQIFKTQRGIATYPSSAAIRDFGEGDYYENDKLVQTGNIEHGYVTLTIDTETKQIEDFKFNRLEQLVHLHTLTITDDFQSTEFNGLQSPGKINKIKVVNNTTQIGMSKLIDDYVQFVMSKDLVASLEYRYGDSSIVALRNVDALSSTDELIENVHSKDWLLSVANDYVTQWCSKASIKDSQKDTIRNNAMQILTDELSKFDLTLKHFKYKLQSLKCNQFMALSNIDIDFDKLGSLVRLAGNNGNGKTTLFRCLKWLMSGRVDQYTNAGATKQNNLALFNDKLEDDDIVAALEFTTFSGIEQQWKLTRTLTRYWKRNAKDITNQFWRNNVTKVNESIFLECLTDGTEYTDESATQKLYEIFGSIWELSRYVMIDQFVLDSLMLMSNTDLNDWILDQLNIDVFKKLTQRWDDIKTSLFRNVSLPKNTEVQLQSYINEVNETLSSLQNVLSEIEQSQSKTSVEISNIRQQIANELTLLANIPDTFESSESIQLAIQQADEHLSKLEEQYSALRQYVDESLIEQIADTKQAIQSIEDTAKIKKHEILQTATDLKVKCAQANAATSELRIKIEMQIQALISKATQDISNAKQKYIELLDKLNDTTKTCAMSYNDKLYAQEVKLTSTLNELQSNDSNVIQQASVLKTSLQAKNEQLQKLSQGKCPVCMSDFSNPSKSTVEYVEQIKASIIDLTKQYQQLGSEHLLLKSQIEKTQNDIANIRSQKIDLQTVSLQILEQHGIEIDELHTLAKELEIAKSEIDSSQTKYNSIKQNSSAYIDATLITALDANIAKSKELQQSIDTIEQKAETEYIAILQQSSSYSTILQQYTKTLQEQQAEISKRDEVQQQIQFFKVKQSTLHSKLEQSKQYEQLQIENEKIKAKLTTLYATESSLNNELVALQNSLTENKLSTQQAQQNLAMFEMQLAQINEYQLCELTKKCLQQALSKNGIMQIVFAKIANSLNADLNELLSSVNFRIWFDIADDNTLKMIDLIGAKTIRPVRQMSGMQMTFAALSLIQLIRQRRTNQIGDILMIDEISGKLSNGDFAAATSDINKINYQNVLIKFLKMFSQTSKVIMVEHGLSADVYDNTLYVSASLNGTSKLELL